MKTAGQILQSARLEKNADLSDIARITKIREKFLRLIEADAYGQLPNGAVAKGFIRNYSEYLGLSPEHILAVFRRDFVENPHGQIVPRGISRPVNRSFWTPKTTAKMAVILIFVSFAVYLIYQYWLLTGPPGLSIARPPESVVTTESTIEISGTTDPDATLFVNSQPVILDKGGEFSLRLPLEPGTNTVLLKSVAISGKITEVTRHITYKK